MLHRVDIPQVNNSQHVLAAQRIVRFVVVQQTLSTGVGLRDIDQQVTVGLLVDLLDRLGWLSWSSGSGGGGLLVSDLPGSNLRGRGGCNLGSSRGGSGRSSGLGGSLDTTLVTLVNGLEVIQTDGFCSKGKVALVPRVDGVGSLLLEVTAVNVNINIFFFLGVGSSGGCGGGGISNWGLGSGNFFVLGHG